MVRLRLSASRSARARVGAPRARCRIDSGVRSARPASRPAAPTASASATSCRCRCRSICSAQRRRLRSRSSCSDCSCAAEVRRAPSLKSICSTTPIGRMIAHAAVLWALRLAVLGLFVVAILAGLLRRPQPLPQHRPDPGVDHLVGGTCLRAGLRRRHLGLVNPWRTVFDAAEWLYRRARRGEASLAGGGPIRKR